MNRRTFLRASGLAMSFPAVLRGTEIHGSIQPLAIAHRANQSADLDGVEDAVYRSFEASEAGFTEILTGRLVFAVGVGVEMDTPDNASQAVDVLAESLIQFYADNVEGTPGETVEASVGRLGDERIGLATTFSLDDDEFIEQFTLGTIVVRQDQYLQILVGASTMGPLSELAAIAEDVAARWPSDDIWDIVPELADMPVGMVLDEEGEYDLGNLNRESDSPEDGPGEPEVSRATEIEAGSLTFTVELLVGGLYLETSESTNSCSGSGFYAVIDEGAEFSILDADADETVYLAVLSQGASTASSCAWNIAVLGLPPRSSYEFFVGQKRVGSASFEEIQPGGILTLEIDK